MTPGSTAQHLDPPDDFSGDEVEATDGSIGKVDSATNDVSASYVVVDAGFWILGRKRLVPTGAVPGVDHYYAPYSQ